MRIFASIRGRSPWRRCVVILAVAGMFASNAMAARLSGQLTQTGTGHGQFFLYVVRVSLSNPVAGTANLSAPGPWSVDVPDGTYFIFAFRDVNGNQLPSRGEPMGFYGQPFPARVQVQGADVPGLDLNLRAGGDSDLDAPVYACADGAVIEVHDGGSNHPLGIHISLQHRAG